MEDRKINQKPQSFIPIPSSRQKTNTTTRVESTRFGFEGSETETNNLKLSSSSFETQTTEVNTKYIYTTKKDEADFQKKWKSSSLDQLSNYKFENNLPHNEDKKDSQEVSGNREEKSNTELSEEMANLKKAVKDQLEANKKELKTLFDIKQREMEEAIREEKSKQERFFKLEIIKIERKFREETTHLTRRFDEEKSSLEQYLTRQLREHLEQQRFEKDERTTCQIDELKAKQELKIQESFSFAFVALFISLLSILVTLVW